MNFLKNHPFAVEAFFESSIVLTYAVDKAQLEQLIPSCLKLDLFEDRWAFIAVAMVQTKHLRPKRFPKFLGNDFFLIGYRIFVRHINKAGKRLRGLYILKSETDKTKMELLGNIFTHYNYSTTDINRTLESNNSIHKIYSSQSNFNVEIDRTISNVSMPAGTPFKEWKDARRFAGPLPHTFTYLEKNNTVLTIKGMREEWIPKPIQVINTRFSFLESLDLKDSVLANAFEINNISYQWDKGIIEKL